MFSLPENFDPIAVAVDWLDACRKRDLDTLLDLYAQEARLECRCDGLDTAVNPAGLATYWRSRFGDVPPVALGLDEIKLEADGVVLDYRGSDGAPVRVHFSFDPHGKISHTRCETPTVGLLKR